MCLPWQNPNQQQDPVFPLSFGATAWESRNAVLRIFYGCTNDKYLAEPAWKWIWDGNYAENLLRVLLVQSMGLFQVLLPIHVIFHCLVRCQGNFAHGALKGPDSVLSLSCSPLWKAWRKPKVGHAERLLSVGRSWLSLLGRVLSLPQGCPPFLRPSLPMTLFSRPNFLGQGDILNVFSFSWRCLLLLSLRPSHLERFLSLRGTWSKFLSWVFPLGQLDVLTVISLLNMHLPQKILRGKLFDLQHLFLLKLSQRRTSVFLLTPVGREKLATR